MSTTTITEVFQISWFTTWGVVSPLLMVYFGLYVGKIFMEITDIIFRKYEKL